MHKLSKANHGDFPSIGYCCAVNATHGSKVYVLWTASHLGKPSKHRKDNEWIDAKWWFNNITEEQKQIIVDNNYFHEEATVHKAQKKHGADYFKGPFSPKKWLVRQLLHRPIAKQLHCTIDQPTDLSLLCSVAQHSSDRASPHCHCACYLPSALLPLYAQAHQLQVPVTCLHSTMKASQGLCARQNHVCSGL